MSATPAHYLSCKVRVNLWDLAGPPAYLEVRNEFYKETQGALLVFDATNRPSFEALGSWLQEAQRCGAPHNMVRSTVQQQRPCRTARMTAAAHARHHGV
jgi:GTPase SAR1 family protein